MEKQTTNLSYLDATGKISYNMTNDYMFRAVLQKNKKVLTELIRSLLHYEKSDILSVEITNPIELRKSFRDKEYWIVYCITDNQANSLVYLFICYVKFSSRSHRYAVENLPCI